MRTRERNIQLTLILVGIVLFVLTYLLYPNFKKQTLTNKQFIEEKKDEVAVDKESTSFEKVIYQALYDLDKPFTVESEKAFIRNEEPDIIFLQNALVTLYLSEGRVVKIVSKEGKFDKVNNNLFLKNDVVATDGDTKIYCDNFDMLATENSVKIFNNVFLSYPAGSLKADIINYDFETKYFTVSNFDDKLIKMKVMR